MRKYISVLLALLLSLNLSMMGVLAAETKYIEDTEFTGELFTSQTGFEIRDYPKPGTASWGELTKQYTITGASGNVIYRVPEGATITDFEVVITVPIGDTAWDLWEIKCGNGGSAGTSIGKSSSNNGFSKTYAYAVGSTTKLVTTDETNKTLAQKGYDTLKIELTRKGTNPDKIPAGINSVKIGYVMPGFMGVTANGAEITDGATVPGGMEQLELNFTSKTADFTINDTDIILTQNGNKLLPTIEKSGTKILIKEAFGYDCDYQIIFNEAFRGKGIENIPETFSFKTSPSDFTASEEVISDDGTNASASLKITNYTSTSPRAVVALISYKGGQILDKKYVVVDSLTAGAVTDVTVPEINSENADEVMLMVWDNLLDMNPLIKAVVQ